MNTKKKLIQSYVELLEKYGSENFTLLEICQNANVSSKATFYHYFEKKSDILIYLATEVTKDIIDDMSIISAKELSNYDKSKEILQVFINISIKEPALISELSRRAESDKSLIRLGENYIKLFEKLAELIFQDISVTTLFKSRLIMVMIGQYINETYLDNSFVIPANISNNNKETLITSIKSIIDNNS